MVVELNFWFCDPQLEAHSCAEPRLLAYIASISVLASWLLTISGTPLPKKNEKNSLVKNLMREIAHAHTRKPLSDLNEILQNGRYPRHNHVGKFW